MSGFVTPNTPNLTDYQTFLTTEGFGANFLPTTSFWIPTTFNVALGIVSPDIGTVGPALYSFAVYNLATDRLINYAQDVEGQIFFQKLRKVYKIYSSVSGVVASSGDGGSNTSLTVPEQLNRLTLADLQTLKTPYGRAYMGIAQKLGPQIWGLT